jgi:serine protease Do
MSKPIPLLAAAAFLLPAVARAAEPGRSAVGEGPGILRQLDGALSQLAERVSPAVVQIQVSGYGPASGEDGHPARAFIVRQRGVGSGVIVDSAGYIVTNAHVVQGAQRIVVVLPAAVAGRTVRQDSTRKRIYPAYLLGMHAESDIALLKIEAAGLPSLPLRATAMVKQGELVFAVGSPQGLASTVTMGVVSSAARQVDLDAPMLFIQTDAPINPGNSGGPLVNAEGEVVGINTFILTGSGGSEGLGFAVPASVARFVYDGLRKRGYVHRVEIGISAQGITPELASGLGLARDWGVVVSDVAPGGPAEKAGMREGDILDAVDNRRIDSLPDLTAALYLAKDALLQIRVLRVGQPKDLHVRAVELNRPLDEMADFSNPDRHLVRQLGILALDVDDKIREMVHLRQPSGVIVVARTLDGTSVNSGLLPGDAIHALNRATIESVEALRRAIDERKRGEPVVLQVERDGRFRYLSFDME